MLSYHLRVLVHHLLLLLVLQHHCKYQIVVMNLRIKHHHELALEEARDS